MTVTLITGASKGPGRETARRLIREGRNVYAGHRQRLPRRGVGGLSRENVRRIVKNVQ